MGRVGGCGSVGSVVSGKGQGVLVRHLVRVRVGARVRVRGKGRGRGTV